jgi:hypothetical protein
MNDAFYFWSNMNIRLMKQGKTVEWLCKQTGLSLRTMRNRIQKGIQPRLDDAIKILDVFGTTLEEFCGIDNFNYAKGFSEGEVTAVEKKTVYDGDFSIPVYEELFSAGHGQFMAEDEVAGGYIAAPQNLKPLKGHLAATYVRGDSMEPTLFDGDTIICDNMGWNGSDGIYIIHYKGMGFVKRLKKQTNGISIISDNPAYKPMFEPSSSEDFHVIGRVHYVIHN